MDSEKQQPNLPEASNPSAHEMVKAERARQAIEKADKFNHEIISGIRCLSELNLGSKDPETVAFYVKSFSVENIEDALKALSDILEAKKSSQA